MIDLRKKKFYLAQEIHNLADRICQQERLESISMHHIPSHIEKTSIVLECTGNYFFDILATEGRKLSNLLDEQKYLLYVSSERDFWQQR